MKRMVASSGGRPIVWPRVLGRAGLVSLLFLGLALPGCGTGGLAVKSAVVYRTGKYDSVNWPGFPDEGYRFYFDDARQSHATIRPSGTSNALRFHVQLYGGSDFGGSRDELIRRKGELRATTVRIVDDIRRLIGAAR